ncbi:enolase-like domain-containing protein [Parabacteroides acidifaciens]|uniref:enolase C-terminal domain-like protein n=1 Tax=Parabacteroides acidifaciens TaxID=2290935 RepID=UPI001ABEEEC8|nr:enolase C-terminal domain-like protein [Parabacteroides acidifaciens]
MNRRNFIKHSSFFAATSSLAFAAQSCSPPAKEEALPSGKSKTIGTKSTFIGIPGEKKIKIIETNANFEREPLIRPFGFKGGAMKEIWQTAALLGSENGYRKFGICTQNVLWSDPTVFEVHSESASNALMYNITTRALQMIEGETFSNPVQLQEDILDELWEYGKKITGNPDLKETFILNALVGIDNAAWLLYCAENGINNFDDMVPVAYRPCLSNHHNKVACIPLMAYNIPVQEIKDTVDAGYFFMKIKIGQAGTQEEMVEKDMKRLSEIHAAIGNARTSYTESGKLPYYFDANGRYEKKETMLRFLDHAKKIGAFDQIAIIEEPFAEEKMYDVSDMGVRIVSDETAHTDKHALERIRLGYSAIALKPIAKTMSMSMKVAQLAYDNNIPCFCADLTVNPILVEWNKIVASRLNAFPGIKGGLGLVESNGHQNYAQWDKMLTYNPTADKSWAKVNKGTFVLDDDYFAESGGIFEQSPHYAAWFPPQI